MTSQMSHRSLKFVEVQKYREIAWRLLERGEILKKMFRVSGDQDDENDLGFEDIPKTIQFADHTLFGEPLFKFAVQQLLSKQIPALWRLLAYISMQIPTVKAIALLNTHQADLAKAKKMSHLELVCTSVIQASAYPINTALHLRYSR